MKMPTSAQELDDYAQKLRDFSVSLRAIARSMEQDKIKSIGINNRPTLDRGLGFVENFVDWGKRALRDEQKALAAKKAK